VRGGVFAFLVEPLFRMTSQISPCEYLRLPGCLRLLLQYRFALLALLPLAALLSDAKADLLL